MKANVKVPPIPGPESTSHERLKWVREKTYPTATAAAEAIGITYSTYAGHENGIAAGIPAKAADRYSRFFRVNLGWLLTGEGHWRSTRSGGEEISVSTVPVIGVTEAGTWREAGDIGLQETKGASVPVVPGYGADAQFAVLVRGNSMNLEISEGDYAICVDLRKSGTEIKTNDIVVAERIRAGLVETTIKVARQNKLGQFELWPSSTDPNHQDVITLNADEQDSEVRVIGLVVGTFRPLRNKP